MNNIYVYLTLVSLLVGGLAGFIGYDNLESAQRQRMESAVDMKEVKSKEEDRLSKIAELEALVLKRRSLQNDVKELAVSIREQEKLKSEYEALDAKLKSSIERQGIKLSISQEAVGQMQDQLAEDTIAIERALEEMNKAFDDDRQRLERRQSYLQEEETVDAKRKAKQLSNLETSLDTVEFALRRVSNLSPLEVKDPWVAGEVTDFNSTLNRVVINLGRRDGVRQNFKFAIFSGEGDQREYKGFCVVKEVEELVSVAVMEMLDAIPPVAGDQIGSLVYRKDQLNYYLAGDFRSKYSKERLTAFLTYCGNRVVDELSADVDFFVMGSLADNEVPLATSLGVSIIPEKFIADYVGD